MAITAGPDGNLWFTELGGAIGRTTPAGVITEFRAGLPDNSAPKDITAGPDGNLWFTELSANNVGRLPLTVTATYTTNSLAVGTHSITAVYGSDANFSGSTSSMLSQTVTQAATTARVSSSSPQNPSSFGQGVTFTATVAEGPLTRLIERLAERVPLKVDWTDAAKKAAAERGTTVNVEELPVGDVILWGTGP